MFRTSYTEHDRFLHHQTVKTLLTLDELLAVLLVLVVLVSDLQGADQKTIQFRYTQQNLVTMAESKDSAVDNLSKAVQSTTLEEGKTENAYDRWSLKDESTIDYGYLNRTKGKGIQEDKEGFYITTAINYTNGPAHMGHAYEAATSDVIARFQRLKGSQATYFVTGADEHGQKIANTAAGEDKQPIDICNKVSLGCGVCPAHLSPFFKNWFRCASRICFSLVWLLFLLNVSCIDSF